MTCEPDHLAERDEPFSWIVLVPFDSIAIIHGELVVEVVVALSNGDESGDDMVARSVLVVERCLTEPMSQGVDTKCGLHFMVP